MDLSATLIFGTFLILAGSIYTWRRRPSSVATSVSLLLLLTTFYTLGNAIQLTKTTPTDILFWVKVQYIGIAAIPGLWLIICIKFAGKEYLLKPLTYISVFLIPLVVLALMYSNNPLFYAGLRFVTYRSYILPVVEPGIWYWVHQGYINTCIIVGAIFIIVRYKAAPPLFFRQALWVVGGMLAGWIGYMVYMFGIGSTGLDWTPFALILAEIFWVIASLRHRWLDITPIARDTVFQSLRAGMLVFDSEEIITDFNTAATVILPCLTSSALGKPVKNVLNEYKELKEFIHSNSTTIIEISIPLGNMQRFYECQQYAIYLKQQKLGTVLALRDISKYVDLREKLQAMSITDQLTGVYNRRYMAEVGITLVHQAQRYHRALSLIMLDIDYFKNINDTYGHLTGDTVLQATVRVCLENLRKADVLIRYGGEEFIILLADTPGEQANILAKRLCNSIANNIVRSSAGNMLRITVSIGITELGENPPVATLDHLLHQADQALYEAKQAGGNCVRFYLAAPNNIKQPN